MGSVEETLRTHGYRLHERLVGWWEVLAVRDLERWIGVGGTRDEALEDLWHRMCPSGLSRELGGPARTREEPPPDRRPEEAPTVVEAGGAGGGPCAAPDILEPRTATPSRDSLAVETGRTLGDLDATEAGPRVGATEPAGGSEPLSSERGPDVESSPEVPVQIPSAAAEAIGEAAPLDQGVAEPPESAAFARNPEPAHAPRSPKEVTRRVDDIQEEVCQLEPEFGLLAPFRQQLLITWWVARLRDLEPHTGGSTELRNRILRVGETAVRLAGVYWPGSIRILGRDSSPAEALKFLQDGSGGDSWQEVAERVQDALEKEESRTNVDDAGWTDEPALDPRCPYATDLLRQVHGEIRNALKADMTSKPDLLPPDWEDPDPNRQAQVLQWARSLRWIRQDVLDGIAWGQAMGRLRWLDKQWSGRRPQRTQLPREFRKQFQETIDPEHCPRVPWAKLLNRDPGRKVLREQERDLKRRFRELDPKDRDGVGQWFLDAARVLGIEVIHEWFRQRPEILGCIQSHPPKDEDLKTLSKTQRRRARRLIAGKPDLMPENPLSIDGAQDDKPEGPDGGNACQEAADPTQDIPWVPDSVLLFTRGKRALFVGNRNDPDLKDTLEGRLKLAHLDLEVGTQPQRRSALEDRITRGSYDIVLAATGFLSHQADQALLPACRQVKIPYLRVGKGRPSAVIRALAHHLGHSVSEAASGGAG